MGGSAGKGPRPPAGWAALGARPEPAARVGWVGHTVRTTFRPALPRKALASQVIPSISRNPSFTAKRPGAPQLDRSAPTGNRHGFQLLDELGMTRRALVTAHCPLLRRYDPSR